MSEGLNAEESYGLDRPRRKRKPKRRCHATWNETTSNLWMKSGAETNTHDEIMKEGQRGVDRLSLNMVWEIFSGECTLDMRRLSRGSGHLTSRFPGESADGERHLGKNEELGWQSRKEEESVVDTSD